MSTNWNNFLQTLQQLERLNLEIKLEQDEQDRKARELEEAEKLKAALSFLGEFDYVLQAEGWTVKTNYSFNRVEYETNRVDATVNPFLAAILESRISRECYLKEFVLEFQRGSYLIKRFPKDTKELENLQSELASFPTLLRELQHHTYQVWLWTAKERKSRQISHLRDLEKKLQELVKEDYDYGNNRAFTIRGTLTSSRIHRDDSPKHLPSENEG